MSIPTKHGFHSGLDSLQKEFGLCFKSGFVFSFSQPLSNVVSWCLPHDVGVPRSGTTESPNVQASPWIAGGCIHLPPLRGIATDKKMPSRGDTTDSLHLKELSAGYSYVLLSHSQSGFLPECVG